jgi:uncharacterized membrane protein
MLVVTLSSFFIAQHASLIHALSVITLGFLARGVYLIRQQSQSQSQSRRHAFSMIGVHCGLVGAALPTIFNRDQMIHQLLSTN